MTSLQNLQEVPVRISPSKIAAYRDCPKKFHYMYVQELQAKGPRKVHFDKGNYFHELAHVYYRLIRDTGMEPGSPVADAMMQQRIREDLSHMSLDNIEVFHIITKQFLRFVREQSAKIDQDIKIEGVEEELNVQVELPSGRVITMFGFIDLRYHSGSYRAIRDHKTGEKSWDGGSVILSNQLLWYTAGTYIATGEVYRPEINFINTHDYKRKIPTAEETFTYVNGVITEKELQKYLEQACILVDELLDCKPTPHYDERVCKYCPYLTPCMMERKGIDPTPIIKAHYVPRDSNPRERSFTNQDSSGDETD